MMVFFKLRLSWAIGALEDARVGASSAKEFDRDWDGSQKRFRALLDVAAADRDVGKREAAARLQKTMLMGAGEAQTQLGYQQEVDFGRQQVKLASTGQAAADIALLGLGDAIDDIRQTTDALATAVGHGKTNHPPSMLVRRALITCASTFNMVATQLAWLAEHGQPGAERTRAASLRAPLEALAARYPATPPAPPPDETPDETPDDGDTPPDSSPAPAS
jgi:hypothetical protein